MPDDHIKGFTDKTGIKTNVVFAAAGLNERLAAEGQNSPADVYIGQDAGALGALAQNDIRRMLAFLVVSGIGLMLAGIAMSGPLGIGGAVLYALHSMVAMTAIFLLAGLMQRRNGAVLLSAAGGLYQSAPLLAAIALVLAFAVAGLPPFSGLWPKIMLVKAGLDIGAWWLVAAIMVSAFLTTAAVARMFLFAFWRRRRQGRVRRLSP
ncbi:MAG: hypothetical protein HC779_05130 [Phyllobacteriaceae bacterium]|nr:hypothetical protein [Phyllobacteriaceae bacterium]